MKLYFKIVPFIIIATLLIPVKLSNPYPFTVNTALAAENGTAFDQDSLSIRMSQYKKIVKDEVSVRPSGRTLDWRLIMAIIKQESKFNENAVSNRGAQGLMQLMPITQMEFVNISTNGFHPQENIKMGISYFLKLYRLFKSATKEDRIKLTLAAYNAGPSRIYDAQDIAAYLGENPFSWRAIQNALPLLSKRYYTLHQSIWDGGKPRNGYFGSWRQTVLYVQSVIKNHEELLVQ